MPGRLSDIVAQSRGARSLRVRRAARAVSGLAIVPIVLLALFLALPSSWVPRAGASERAEDTVHQHTRARKKPSPGAETTFGREGDPRKVRRSVSVETSDAMRYFPDQIFVKKGQTVHFVVRNAGELPHEMVLGTMDDLKKQAALMKKGGAVPHDAGNVVHVEPGGTAGLVWHFTRAGEFYYGCLVPGHFEAGMIGTVVVR